MVWTYRPVIVYNRPFLICDHLCLLVGICICYIRFVGCSPSTAIGSDFVKNLILPIISDLYLESGFIPNNPDKCQPILISVD